LQRPPEGLRYGQCSPIRSLPGRSLVPLLRGATSEAGAQTVLIENEEPFLGLNSRTLVTPSHKLTVYGGQAFGELFDLAVDACELRNLWNEPDSQAIKAELMQQLLQRELASFSWQPLPTASA